MAKKQLTITNQKGLHARASAQFVTCARGFKADIEVCYGGQCVSGRSIMGLMMLVVAKGGEISIEAKGEDSTEALEALSALVNNKFGEE